VAVFFSFSFAVEGGGKKNRGWGNRDGCGFVSGQLFSVVVKETVFITFDGAGLDLPNLVTMRKKRA